MSKPLVQFNVTEITSPLTQTPLVRSETIADGSCFYHSIVNGLLPEYQRMTVEEKKEFVYRHRDRISDTVSREKWCAMGHVSSVQYQMYFSHAVDFIYKLMSGADRSVRLDIPRVLTNGLVEIFREQLDSSDDMDVIDTIGKHYSLDEFHSELLNPIFQKYMDRNLVTQGRKLTGYICHRYKNKLSGTNESPRTINYHLGVITGIFQSISDLIIDVTVEKYRKTIRDPTSHTDMYTIAFILDYFNINAFFLKDSDYMPYATHIVAKTRPYMIILWCGEAHFEPVGIVSKYESKIQWVFSSSNDLIRCIGTFLNHPCRIPSQYPHLVQYLPKNTLRAIQEQRLKDMKSPSPDNRYSPSLSL